MNRHPVAVRILEIVGNGLPTLSLVWIDDSRLLGIDGKRNPKVHSVGHGIGRLSDHLRDGLSGILVVNRHIDAAFLGNEAQHAAPARPFRRNVVADGGLALGCERASAAKSHHERRAQNHPAEVTAVHCVCHVFLSKFEASNLGKHFFGQAHAKSQSRQLRYILVKKR